MRRQAASERASRTPEPVVREPPAGGRASDTQLDELMARLAARERVVEAALPGPRDFLGWPSWSMDSGLTPAQETFVELRSPQQVLDDSRALRELLCTLRRWVASHGDDVTLHEALSRFATATTP